MVIDSMGPYLVPSAVIGLGRRGGAVARGVGEALRDRSPEIARACSVLSLEDGDPAAPELIRAHIKASRMAGAIRALEQDGLMQLDPVIAPPTHLYLVVALAEDPGLELLRMVLELATQAAAELKAQIAPVALVDLGDGESALPLPAPVPGLPVYVVEPVTCRGMVLDPGEYEAAQVELLVAAVQPGAGHILVGDGPIRSRAGVRGTVGTLGIAWLGWSPAELRVSLAGRLARDAVLRCLEDPAAAGAGGTTAPAWPMRETEAWQASQIEQRAPALLAGLPFTAAAGDRAPLPAAPLFGEVARRRRPGAHLRRCATTLDRRLQRWQRRIRSNAYRQAQREGEALDRTVRDLLRSAGGPARARALAGALAREAARRVPDPPPEAPPRLFPLLRALERAEALPDANRVAMILGGAWLVFSLIWWLAHGPFSGWLAAGAVFGAAAAAYGAWRPRRIRAAQEDLHEGLCERAIAFVDRTQAEALEEVDQALEQRCSALLADLDRAATEIRERCAVDDDGPAPGRSALSFPLAPAGATGPVYDELRPLLPEVAAHLAQSGCLEQWRDPGALLGQARAATLAFLSGRLTLDPGQLAARAHGDHLAERMQASVQGLLDWSAPLLAAPGALPEGQRWLLWPDGLPCPPVPADVAVIPFARSCAAALTVVRGLEAGIRTPSGRKSQETSA